MSTNDIAASSASSTIPRDHLKKLSNWLNGTKHLRSQGFEILVYRGVPITAYIALDRDMLGHTFSMDFEFPLADGGTCCVPSPELEGMLINAGDEDGMAALCDWHCEMSSAAAEQYVSARGLSAIEYMLDRYFAINPDHASTLSA